VKKRLTIIFLLAILPMLTGFGYVFLQLTKSIVLPAATLVYEVAPGTPLSAVTSDLVNRGIVVVPAWMYRLYGSLSQKQGSLKAGEFEITRAMNGVDLLKKLRQGPVVEHQMTFLEGWRFRDWREQLASQSLIRQSINSVPDDEIMALLDGEHLDPEGQFFPDTYQYVKGETDIAILRRAHRRMVDALNRAWRNRSDTTLTSPYEALILASIVEKETGFSLDRGKVARVFVNRLQLGMRLQTDPTVIYGLPDFDGDLTRGHLRQASAYNTYLNKGLPPTPICNPGLAAIEAVLAPEPGDYLFFVAQGDGRSFFSTTLSEHNEAVAKFQREGRADVYQSAPPINVPLNKEGS
jgi:UPF0755 protein|tara:strand:- start:21812 stop:22864 length:1053 start_codon:yes stop_codon:yes gene_type:complete